MGVMTPEVADVLSRLKRASAARKRAEAALERARAELLPLIIEADDLRVKQVDIVEITGYNREHIRRIVRDEEERREKGATLPRRPAERSDH